MIEFVLRFKEVSYFYISLICVTGCILWAYYGQKQKKPVILWPVIIVNFALFVAWGALSSMNHDDVAFLHFSWLISQGLVPFRDYWDHHSPLLPVVLSPFMKIAPRSPAIFDIARIFSGCVFVINAFLGWHIAKQVWQNKARLSVYLLVVSSAGIFGHYLMLRPDIVMMFFVLAGMSLCLEIPRKGISACFLAGIAFGIAMSFIFKQYLLVLLPVIAVFMSEKQGRYMKLAAYAAGFFTGILPLASYLISAGILRDFFSWVIGFNGKALQVSVHFPLALISAGIWATYVLIRRFRSAGDKKALLAVCAFYLSTLSSLTTMTDLDGLYYLGLWYFLCAISACGAGLPELLNKVSSFRMRVLIVGLVFGILLAPNAAFIWQYRDGDFARDKRAAAELMRYTRDDMCVIILPVHPVFAVDATRLYSGWQYYFTVKFPRVRLDVAQAGMARRIMHVRPAVVMCRLGKRDFILELYQRKLITSGEYKELIAFLTANYRQEQIGDEVYYIRSPLQAL
jgi:hypothetical protein